MEKIRLERLDAVAHLLAAQGDGQRVLLVKTEVPSTHVVHLRDDDQGADDQPDRDGKLRHHQHPPEIDPSPPGPLRSFQHRDRRKGGEKEGRIDAGQQAHAQSHPQQPHQHTRILHVAQFQTLFCQIVEERQQHFDQHQGTDQGQQADEHRLAQELADQLPPPGAHYLAHPHLPGPLGRAGGGQVHEVDAGDQQNERGDHRKYVHVGDMAVRLQLPKYVGVQVDIDQRLEKVNEMYGGHLQQLADLAIDYLIDPGRYQRRIRSLLQAQIGGVRMIHPVPLGILLHP